MQVGARPDKNLYVLARLYLSNCMIDYKFGYGILVNMKGPGEEGLRYGSNEFLICLFDKLDEGGKAKDMPFVEDSKEVSPVVDWLVKYGPKVDKLKAKWKTFSAEQLPELEDSIPMDFGRHINSNEI